MPRIRNTGEFPTSLFFLISILELCQFRLASLLSISLFFVPQVDVRRQHGLAAADPEVRHDARLQEHNPRGAAGPDLGRGTLWSGMQLFLFSVYFSSCCIFRL